MILIFLLLAQSLFAAPVGNPADPVLLEEGFLIPDTFWSNVQASATQDFLIQKKLKTSRKAPVQTRAKIEGNSQMAGLAWCIREKFNFQINLGSAYFKWNWKEEFQRTKGSDAGFFLGGDVKVVLLEAKGTVFAADGQAGRWGSRYNYWQGAFALTHRFSYFSPYVGWVFNGTHFEEREIKFHEEFLTGPFVGCTFTNGSKISVNAEYRAWFEAGVSLSAQLRF